MRHYSYIRVEDLTWGSKHIQPLIMNVKVYVQDQEVDQVYEIVLQVQPHDSYLFQIKWQTKPSVNIFVELQWNIAHYVISTQIIGQPLFIEF